MPLDGQEVTPRLRRQILIDALRKEMPAGFEWDYQEVRWDHACGTVGCAIGLASRIWPDSVDIERAIKFESDESLARFFGIDKDYVYAIFYGMDTDTTPQDVANALEALD